MHRKISRIRRNSYYLLKSIPRVLKALLGTRVPLRVVQFITLRCNLDCGYCARHEDAGGELTTAEVKALMSSFRKAGTLYWGFNGGEPLLREDIGELISHAKSLGMFVNISTNGTLIPARRRAVRQADLVNLSLEGPKEIHDSQRSKSFNRLQSAVQVLNEEGVRFSFLTVINRMNIPFLDKTLAFVEKNRSSVVFQPVRLQKEDSGGKSAGYFPTREEMSRAVDLLLAAKNKGKPVASTTRFLQEIKATWPNHPPRVTCWAGRIHCAITPEGGITACCDTLIHSPAAGRAGNSGRPARELLRLPVYQCQACYSAFPLEANLVMSMCLRSPRVFLRESLSSLHHFRC